MYMFKVNDKVMHFRDGLAIIKKETVFNGETYFIIELTREGGETVYVPKEKAIAVIRPISSKKEGIELIAYIKTIEPEYITNTKQRRDSFKRRLGSGDIKDLAYLARQLYFFHHPEILDIPVKFGPADVEMLKHASNTMYDELSLTFKIKRELIEDKVLEMINS